MNDRTKPVKLWHVDLFVHMPGQQMTPEKAELLAGAGAWSHDSDEEVLHLYASQMATRMQVAVEEVRMNLLRALRQADMHGSVSEMRVRSDARWMADQRAALASAPNST